MGARLEAMEGRGQAAAGLYTLAVKTNPPKGNVMQKEWPALPGKS